MAILVKIHSNPSGKVIALCDSGIIGKTFEEGDRQLNLDTQFYRGDEMTSDQIRKLIKTAYIANAVGKESIAFLRSLGLVSEDNIIKIKDIPHAQCVIESGRLM